MTILGPNLSGTMEYTAPTLFLAFVAAFKERYPYYATALTQSHNSNWKDFIAFYPTQPRKPLYDRKQGHGGATTIIVFYRSGRFTLCGLDYLRAGYELLLDADATDPELFESIFKCLDLVLMVLARHVELEATNVQVT